jgi:hypothetical protein
MTVAAAIGVAVFAGSLFVSWRLARFIAACDRFEADMDAIRDAEAIVQRAYSYSQHPSTWPKGDES